MSRRISVGGNDVHGDEAIGLVPGHIGHESLHSVLFFVLFGVLLLCQIGLYLWKKKHYRSFQNITLLGLWLIPSILSTAMRFYRFLALWVVYSVVTGYLISQASQRPLYKETPSRVYAWFNVVYKGSYYSTLIGYAMVVMDLLGASRVHEQLHSVTYFGGLLLFYGLYYGVLGRDCAEMVTDRMASVMGFTGKGLPMKTLPPKTCCICGDIYNPDTAIKLECNHLFHEFCLRGWTIIGKKDTCPFCSEKVNLKKVFSNPWEKPNILWANLLDSLRYLIVWNPIILSITQLVIYFVDPGA